jgi:FdhD protein
MSDHDRADAARANAARAGGGPDGARPVDTHVYRDGRWELRAGHVIEERHLSLFVNGIELATIMATPRDQEAFALGFLLNEGLIAARDDVRALHVCPSGACVDVWLKRPDFEPPRRLIMTSGCGGGVTFDDLAARHAPLASALRVTPEQLWARMDELYQAAGLYRQAGGVHTSALAEPERVVLVAEDIGRHNTVDKLRGLCALAGRDPRDHILLCTGRISSEMLSKAMKMGVPIVASRTSPTSLSVELGRTWGLTVIGYLRRGRLTVYSGAERLQTTPPAFPLATRPPSYIERD